jgi:hypothetical protein
MLLCAVENIAVANSALGGGPKMPANIAPCYLERDVVGARGREGARPLRRGERGGTAGSTRWRGLCGPLAVLNAGWFGPRPRVANNGRLDDPGFHVNPTAIGFPQNQYTEGRQVGPSRKCTTVEGDMK